MRVFMPVISVLMILFSTPAMAGWVLYDDFNSGTLDTSKWIPPDHSDTGYYTVEDGRLKIVTSSNYSSLTSLCIYLNSSNFSKIIGIKADTTVHVDSGGKLSSRITWKRTAPGGTDLLFDLKDQVNADGTTNPFQAQAWLEGSNIPESDIDIWWNNFNAPTSSAHDQGGTISILMDSESNAIRFIQSLVGTVDYSCNFFDTYRSSSICLRLRRYTSATTGYVTFDNVYVLYEGNTPDDYTYYLPYLEYDTDDWSSLALSGVADQAGATATITYYSNSGQELKSETKTLSAHGQTAYTCDVQGAVEGWSKITSTAPLYGLELIGGKTGGPMMDLDLKADLHYAFVIPHIDTAGEPWQSTASMCNPGTDAASLILRYYSSAGAASSEKIVSIPAMGAVQIDLGELFGKQTSGSVTVSSDKPVTGFLEFDGTSGGMNWKTGLSMMPATQ